MFRLRIVFMFLLLALAACSQSPQPHSFESPLPTATLAPLEAQVDVQVALDNFPPSAPFVVQFNQPVSLDSASNIVVSPALEGAVTWNEAHTRLTLVPTRGFVPGTLYHIALGDYTSDSGAGFATPPRWEIRTLDHPRIVDQQPRQSTWPISDRHPAIRLTFDRAMDPASVNAALSIQPHVALDTSWQDRTLTIVPRQPLTPGLRYQLTLTRTAADIYGLPLSADCQWEYQLKDMVAEKTWPSRNGDHSTPLVIRFNYPMDTTGVQQALAIEPPITGTVAWSDDRSVITMTPDSPLPGETLYTVGFKNPLRDARGDELPAPAPLSFTTPPPILAVSPDVSVSVHPATPIEVTFDRPMDHKKTQDAFQITPTVSGTFTWSETTLVFRPKDGYLDPFTAYTVTIATSASDRQGAPVLRQPYTWSFQTGETKNVADFGWGPNAQVVNADGRRAIQFQSFQADPTPINFELYRLSLEQFLDRYASGFRGVAGEEKRPISTQGTTLAKSWQIKTTQSSRDWENVQEVLIPKDVPPGLYILNMTAGHLNGQLILILTRHNIALKQAEGQIVAWVTDINGGHIADMEVVVYARNARIISQGRTDENGVYRATVNRDPQPLIVIARNDQDITAAGLSNEWQSRNGQWWGWWQPAPKAQSFAAHIYTDRPIYRPGQTVFFKSIIRKDDDAIISLPANGKFITVRIRDARDNVVQTFPLATNELGTVNGKFQLAEGAMLGDYAIEVVIDGESHRQVFKVQDYRKPDYEVSVTTNASKYIAGDTISVSVDSRYFFGEPVPNAHLNVKLYRLGNRYYGQAPQGESDTVWYQANDEQEISAVTDANGRYSFTLNAKMDKDSYPLDWMSSLKQNTWGIEATVDDGSHQTVSSFAVVKVFDAAEQVRLDIGDYFKTPGQPFTVRADVTNILDQPVRGQTLSLQLRRYNSRTNNYSTVIQSSDLTTGADGKASLPFTVQEPGYYQLSLTGTDRLENSMSYETWVYVFSDASRWTARAGNDLSVASDRSSYAPGETARLLIQSSFGGPALLTFERGTTRRERLIKLTAPLTQVDVPIQPDDAPNIFVTVNAWVQQDTTRGKETYSSVPDSRLHTASVELRVPVTDKTLKVSITPDYGGASRSFAPREKVTFNVRVTNARGEPVPAELSLALVDEAIFSLSKELSGPIFDAFYHPRANIVHTYDAMALSRYLGGGMGGGGGGGDGSIAGNPRSNFPDTAAWIPVIRTDANGEAVVTLTLPDSLTSWRVTAKAVTTNTEVGETFINVTTHQPIVVRPILPRSLTAGDQVELSAMLHNYSDRPRDIQVSIEAPALTIKSQITQTVTITPGEIRIVGWSAQAAPPLQAGEGSGGGAEAKVTIRALSLPTKTGEGQGGGDAVRLTLPIRPLAVPDVESQIGEFTGKLNTTFTLPRGALGLSSVKIQVSRSIAGTLLDGLAYLTGYPYGCVEQTMSRALPNAVVGRAFHQLGAGNPTLQADLPPKINAGLQKLYGYQHNDGGWGWWYDDSTHDYQTAWVIFGLSVTKEAGYEVDPEVIKRGAEWIKGHLDGMDIRTRAYALYSLSVAGYGNLPATKTLAAQPDKLDTFSQAALALALHQLGAKTEAQQMLDVLVKSAVVESGEVYWPNARDDGHYYEKTMASTTRSTALALSAFVHIAPQHELEPGIVRWLMNHRKPEGWGSTNETSFAILALTDHLLATEELMAADTPYRVELNGKMMASGTLGRGEPAVSLEMPAPQMTIGSNDLRIQSSSNGRLYYVIVRRALLPKAEIKAAGRITVTREYLDAKTGKPIETAKPGQLVQVRLKVQLPDDGFYIIVEDNLPGGLEALNEKLNTTSHAAAAEQEPRYYWQEFGYNNKEVHGDRVSFFITEMSKSEQVFTYLARATHAGEFVALPVEVYAMYDLTTWGRSASNGFVIGE